MVTDITKSALDTQRITENVIKKLYANNIGKLDRTDDFFFKQETTNQITKSLFKGEQPRWQLSANPAEEGRTAKVSLVYIVRSRPVRAKNGDPVSERQPFPSTFYTFNFETGFQ